MRKSLSRARSFASYRKRRFSFCLRNNDPLGVQKGYTLLDARVQIAPVNGPWSLAVYGKNLTDEHIFDLVADVAIVPGRDAVNGRGRQIGLELGARF